MRRVPLFRRSVVPSLACSVLGTRAKARASQQSPESGPVRWWGDSPAKARPYVRSGTSPIGSQLLNTAPSLGTLTVVDVRHSFVLRLTRSVVLRKQVRW
jgi:hypothetical protein